MQTYELQAIWKELFYDYNYNGHSYLRPEMKINSEDVVIAAGGCEGFYARHALNAGASKVVIFEPCNDMVEALTLTFRREIELGKVIVVQKALGKN